ncbi:MAG: hypothetical protein MJ133_11785 [Lachnospiraceae bacterium]|nr:hypothetical protein [Lachnospiraceae bacterium]
MNLLYPNGTEHIEKISDTTYQNLAIEEIVDMVGVTKEEKDLIRGVLGVLPKDENTVVYRQEILKDLIDNEDFCNELAEILKGLDILKEFNTHNHFSAVKRASLWNLIDYMSEMDIYIKIVEDLSKLLEDYEMQSKGLKEIKTLLADVINMDQIDELKEIVNSLRAEISTLKSITVGINLSPELHPEEVRVLGFNTVPFFSKFSKTNWGASFSSGYRVRYKEPSQFMKYICDDMENALSKSVQSYKSELKKYINFKGYFLLDICNDLKFYLLMAKFGRRLSSKGYSFSYPVINSNNTSVKIEGVYNVRLINKEVENIVKNDFEFSEKEKVFILTGPNRGGKTMLTQAVGITALFASQGLFVPADSYEGYIFDNILTHFPADENETIDLGRLGEEAVRIQKIVKQTTDKTLVLLNETYSSTSAVDGVYLAKDLVHILKHKNVPTIFNTHLHDLARMTEEMNKWDGNGDVVSLTMEIVDNVNTYRVIRKMPDSSSFAKNIAFKYGVTYEQMMEE